MTLRGRQACGMPIVCNFSFNLPQQHTATSPDKYLWSYQTGLLRKVGYKCKRSNVKVRSHPALTFVSQRQHRL